VGGFRDGTKPLVGYAQKLTLHGRSWCGLGRASERLPSKREIKFTKSCRSRRNPLKSSKLRQDAAIRFSPFCSPSVRNLVRFAATCTTFLLRSGRFSISAHRQQSLHELRMDFFFSLARLSGFEEFAGGRTRRSMGRAAAPRRLLA